ncbi:Nitrogen fixation protein VnfA [Rubripirellula tenax]|uniref:Nitrogen fixation protein VnfA n=1 Tax=Rubripirellula tenax TaxID=2528015 RepID=A0A5C6F310_9BACT|nr:sigma 54-interacting transcriptional regulator [Rubripirellula tenax]TWU54797.1 Nitrogen fixation protein VnfA [Rubripirellula tenax]
MTSVLGLIVEDRPEQRELLERAVRSYDGVDWELRAFEGEFRFKDVLAWVTTQLSEAMAYDHACLFLDLLWKRRPTDQYESHNNRTAHNFLTLLLCPEDVLDRVRDDFLVDGLRLLIELAPRAYRNLSIAVISKFGVDSLRSFARSLGADTTIQKFPELREFFANAEPREVNEARFHKVFSGLLFDMYLPLVQRDLIDFESKGATHVTIAFDEIEGEHADIHSALVKWRHVNSHRAPETDRPLPLDYESLEHHVHSFVDTVVHHARFSFKQFAQRQMSNNGTVDCDGIVGQGMLPALTEIRRTAPLEQFGVFIYGEPGTGKERLARFVHEVSPRASGPYVIVDCTNLPENTNEVEYILFGVVPGAIPHVSPRRGLVEEAAGGTIFFDEIAEVQWIHQERLMRFLNDRMFRPFGESNYKMCDARFVFATNKNLESLVAAEKFKGDFRDRIRKAAPIEINIPPLRERRDDVTDLVDHFLAPLKQAALHTDIRIEADAVAELVKYHWPSNVRELNWVVDKLYLLADEGVISAELVRSQLEASTGGVSSRPDLSDLKGLPLDERLAIVEEAAMLEAYEAAKGVRTEMARLLGKTDRTKITKWCKSHESK